FVVGTGQMSLGGVLSLTLGCVMDTARRGSFWGHSPSFVHVIAGHMDLRGDTE
ncbi:hypothetical protein KIPB_004519, partial [Kipferlia bialata]